jgi:diaminopimelate epimerase
MTEFWKMSGAGNDFIAFNNIDGNLDGLFTERFIRSICERRFFIGADGVLELSANADHAFSMGYWNRDGRRAQMCGNGGRCICVFARLMGTVEDDGPFLFESDAGTHIGLVTGADSARMWMTEPVIHSLQRAIDYGGAHPISLVDSGVRHAVLFTPGDDEEFNRFARAIRLHPEFSPEGANVNFAHLTGPGRISIRTFEMGVEAETLACGTGAVAVAVCAHEIFGSDVELPLEIVVRSGQVLTVGRDDNGWWLQGEARVVYSGILDTPLT